MRVSLEGLLVGALVCGCGLGCSSAVRIAGGDDAAASVDGADAGFGSVLIIRGDPSRTTWFSLTIEGHGLAGDEGRVVTARIGSPDVDADGACTPGVDRVYTDYSFLDTDVTLTLSDSIPAPPVDAEMLLLTNAPTPADCQPLNDPWPAS